MNGWLGVLGAVGLLAALGLVGVALRARRRGPSMHK